MATPSQSAAQSMATFSNCTVSSWCKTMPFSFSSEKDLHVSCASAPVEPLERMVYNQERSR